MGAAVAGGSGVGNGADVAGGIGVGNGAAVAGASDGNVVSKCPGVAGGIS